jgi:hypothetical protein
MTCELAQLVERILRRDEVVGSSPTLANKGKTLPVCVVSDLIPSPQGKAGR